MWGTEALVRERDLPRRAANDLLARHLGACLDTCHAAVEFEYGERECTLEDPAGHRWQLTQTIRDVAPEEWGGVSVGD